jgi:hypothetical protein
MADLSRRTWIAQLAAQAAAVSLAAAPFGLAFAAEPRQGVSRRRGTVSVDGKPARRATPVTPGSIVTTGARSEAVFVVGADAFLLRANSRVELQGAPGDAFASGLRLVTGAILSVFAPGGGRRIDTQTATIGIRGTGIYVEVQRMRTYVCTCYGEAELIPVAAPNEAETVRTMHHDQPRYVYPSGMPRMIEQAPVANHSDAELVMLERLVGRRVPFNPARY